MSLLLPVERELNKRRLHHDHGRLGCWLLQTLAPTRLPLPLPSFSACRKGLLHKPSGSLPVTTAVAITLASGKKTIMFPAYFTPCMAQVLPTSYQRHKEKNTHRECFTMTTQVQTHPGIPHYTFLKAAQSPTSEML